MMTPLLFKLENRKILVVGGGKVAARRIVKLLENGARVVAVSPDFSVEVIKIKHSQLTLIQSHYHKEQLTDIDLAVAATDNQVLNKQIKKDCKSLKIWCNRVDDPEDSDFIFPSVLRRGDLTVSVCTEGASPFLTKSIVEELTDRYDQSYVEKTALLRLLRRAVLAGNATPSEKTEKLKELSQCSNEELKDSLERLTFQLDQNKEITDNG